MVEAVGLSLIGLIAFFLRSYEDINPLPILGALTLGLQRLLPQLQTLFTSFANVTTSYEMSSNMLSLISSIEAKNQFPGFDSNKIMKLESIQLKNIAYKYPNTQNYALKNINLKINKGDKIGIIGSTGAGKSTIVELITTLLEPSKGEIFFNGWKEWLSLENTQKAILPLIVTIFISSFIGWSLGISKNSCNPYFEQKLDQLN